MITKCRPPAPFTYLLIYTAHFSGHVPNGSDSGIKRRYHWVSTSRFSHSHGWNAYASASDSVSTRYRSPHDADRRTHTTTSSPVHDTRHMDVVDRGRRTAQIRRNSGHRRHDVLGINPPFCDLSGDPQWRSHCVCCGCPNTPKN